MRRTETPGTDDRRPAWLHRGATRGAVFGWLVVLIAAVSGAATLSDNSFLTHLTTGRLILDGHFPSTDPYSFTAFGHPWVIQSWFASVLYALGDRIGHGAGIRLMIAVLSGLLAAVLWRLTRPAKSVVARLAAVAPALVIGGVIWGPRPLLFGLIGFALVLLVLREERDPRWLLPVMWVWVNTHGSFPLGLVLIVVYGLGVWADRGSTSHVVRAFGWSVAGVLLGAINPLGPKLLWFPVALLGKQKVLSNMIEWQAPTFQTTWERIFLAAFLVAVALVPRLSPGSRYRLLLPALVFVALGLTASRNIALASFVLVPLLATELEGLGSLASTPRSSLYTGACGVIVLATVAIVGARVAEPAFDLTSYPTAAAGWLASNGRLTAAHRIAARDTVGNYLEFRNSGRTKVFVDDRVDMFPESVVDDEKTLVQGGVRWRSVLDRWKIDTVLWEKDAPLTSVLLESPEWKLAKSFHTRGSQTTWMVFERVPVNGR